jgi:hypothetical protein
MNYPNKPALGRFDVLIAPQNGLAASKRILASVVPRTVYMKHSGQLIDPEMAAFDAIVKGERCD